MNAAAVTLRGAAISTDTRRLRPGDVFLALHGQRYDGAAFIPEAVARGAAGIVARPQDLDGLELPAGLAVVAVDDPRAALIELARARRDELTGTVVGVTGSMGKTTTCGLIADALGAHATEDGRNTHEGVAATMAGAPPGGGTIVVELGMRARGQIAWQAELVRPTMGLITGIGAAHVGLLGSVEGVAAAKAELIAALPAGGTLVVPAREPLLDRFLRDDLSTVTHGPGGDVEAIGVEGDVAVLRVGRETVRVRTRATQPHNLANVAAAVALLRAAGAPVPDELRAPLPPFRWQPGRIGEVELVLDCANSSPPALEAALRSFAAEPAAGRRIAVLGLMADLGEHSDALHRAAGEQARRLGIDELVAVGGGAAGYLDGFGSAGRTVADPRAARRLLADEGRPGDRALVKASRAAALTTIVDP